MGKILHLSFHQGCVADIDHVAKMFGWQVEHLNPVKNYNIGSVRAREAYLEHKEKIDEADIVITSDTAPLSRIIYEHAPEKRLVIWVCNRFDYADQATNDCGFPDPEYYSGFKAAMIRSNTKVISYTEFERIYANHWHGIDWGPALIKPTGAKAQNVGRTATPESPYLIPPYHNDIHCVPLEDICKTLQIHAVRRRYTSMEDLASNRGIIHIPYAWSNFALFEALTMGMRYFIPTLEFLIDLSGMKSTRDGFFWSPPWSPAWAEVSEWYCKANRGFLTEFESPDHLAALVEEESPREIHDAIMEHMRKHYVDTMAAWHNVLYNWIV